MKKIAKPIIITTINTPTAAVKKFAKLTNFQLYVAGDKKTPEDWSYPNSNFISFKTQKRKYPKLSSTIAENHYARKNFAYLVAIQNNPEYIYETDDDNFPNTFFPNFLQKETSLTELEGKPCFNILSLFTSKKVWPRGLPLNYIDAKVTRTYKNKVNPLIQQSLADSDPDVDAIYRLVIHKEIAFKKNLKFSLAPNTFCPFNSQNTYWKKEVFPLLYLPFTVSMRTTDIWRGYVAQRILWELGSRLIYLSPSVYQKRNIHNFMTDFKQEQEVFLKTEDLFTCLQGIKLSGSVSDMLYATYVALAKEDFVKKQELVGVKEWLKQF